MNNYENRMNTLPEGNDRKIELVVNRSEMDQAPIDLGKVIRNFKQKKRIFAWVLVLCLTLGICTPLLLYQLSEPQLTVSSVVTLRYEAPVKILQEKTDGTKDKEWVIPDDPEYAPVSDLSAPDGSDLDPNLITSSYVLQTALDEVNLSRPITTTALRANIKIETLLTEESQRTKEVLAGLAEAKNADAYKQLQTAEIKYQNRFVVFLTNGFTENEDSNIKIELKDAELKLLLDQILSVYNDYLVRTYADVRLPDDAFSIIHIEELDVLDSLDQLRAGIQELYNYCDEKTDTVKTYRSWQSGRSLNDWMEILDTFKSINVDYLYSMAGENAITRDKTSLLTSWKYMLRTAQNELDKVNARITETKKILSSYKNDEVYISMQESDASKSTRVATDYYNELILQQIENYEKAAELKASIADYTDRIMRLNRTEKTTEVSSEVEEELKQSMTSAREMYEEIRAHMEEVFSSSMYTTFEDHSAAQGRTKNFLAASAKRMLIGGIAGVFIAIG